TPYKIENDVFITDTCIGNSNIFLSIKEDKIFIGDKEIKFIDYKDAGDSYNYGPIETDTGIEGKVLSSKILYQGNTRSALEIKVDIGDILTITVSLDKEATSLKFHIVWENTKTNHHLQFIIDTNSPITKTLSEDMSNIIEREFDPTYDIRKHLPKTRGIEAKSNNAPMHRGVCTNGVGIVTCGITQYEVFNTELRIPLLRATGVISNPKNTSRSTPAGPPLEIPTLQQLGNNESIFEVFLDKNLKENIANVFNYCIVL
ncbi:MAG: hypothetical protein NC200_01700, partial [Candidatus Gastranaerophilales bacterium]|nr:hypothetical protein [Candidatus Gastranaerophilales bacterium]